MVGETGIEKTCDTCKCRNICVTRRRILLDHDQDFTEITGDPDLYACLVGQIRGLLAKFCQFYICVEE